MEGLPSQQRLRDNADTRFHYPQSTRLLGMPQSKHAPGRTDQSFPPHPSIRVPPNVKTAGRQVPAGVGVAPRPVPQLQGAKLHAPPAQPLNTANTVQSFKFPQVPPPIPDTKRARDLAHPGKGRFNMHDSYVSSIDEDSATARTTPSSKSGRFATPPRPPRESSVYPESEYSPQPAYPSSRIMPPSEFPTPGRSTESDSRDRTPQQPARIATTDLGGPVRPKLGEISPASSRTTAMNALTAAIAAGFSQHERSPGDSTPPARTFSPMRMPFEATTSRPRTPETKEELEPPQLLEAPVSNTTAKTPDSASSTNPLLGLGINPGMSSKVPVNKRPAKLDIDAVRDMEARGSTTSLAELIKRATRLASNLDRGKTASRLGMLNMYGSNEKLGQPHRRNSSMSDLMSAFPAPALGGTPRRDTIWPLGEKDNLYDEHEISSKAPKRKRKCCGLSLPVFIAILIIVVVLVAAAVLLPIFLILVPKQHESHFDFSTCPTAYPCLNGGTSIISQNDCQCVCSNGFLGAHCDMLGSSTDCTTTTLADGARKYNNATVGLNIMPAFADSDSRFDVPLNASSILSLFSLNNFSCTSENQLVDFNGTTASTSQRAKAKRFIMIPGSASSITLPTRLPLRERQEQSSNGIVFAASSTEAPTTTPAPAAVSTVTSISATDATPSASASATASFAPLDVSEDQVSFARVVVLYVLQRSNAVSVAVTAQQKIQNFFLSASGSSNDTEKVVVGFGELQLTADFGKLELTDGGGRKVGGS